MEQNGPIIKEINQVVTINDKEITIKQLIFRPIMKRIVIIYDNERIILYEKDDYDLHKYDADEVILEAFKNKLTNGI